MFTHYKVIDKIRIHTIPLPYRIHFECPISMTSFFFYSHFNILLFIYHWHHVACEPARIEPVSLGVARVLYQEIYFRYITCIIK